MFNKKLLAAALIAAGSIGAIATPLPGIAATYREVIIERAPPAPRVERVPAPRRGYVWSPGYWNWQGNRHHWVVGSWVRARPGQNYHAKQWVERDGHWVLQGNRWDKDGDGVPNNRDAHPNNPKRS